MKNMLFLLLVLFCVSLLGMTSMAVRGEEVIPKQVVAPDSVKLIVSDDNKVRVENVLPGTVMEVFSCIGLKVASFSVHSSDTIIRLSLPRGYYFCRVGPFVRKIVIL